VVRAAGPKNLNRIVARSSHTGQQRKRSGKDYARNGQQEREQRTGEMGLLKGHLRCISENEWMWWRRLLNLAYEITEERPFKGWKYTEPVSYVSLQKEIGNDDTAKQRPMQLMDCTANIWNAAGIKKLDGRRESERITSQTCR
jgi:hypothetical protein